MGAPSGTPHQNSDNSVRLVIGSRFENLALVHALIEGLARERRLDEDTTQALLYAVIEAGTNAIQHGNVFAADKSVTFDFRLTDGTLEVQVDDRGHGFDPEKLVNPTDESALLSTHGRGIYLMRQLVDEVSFDIRPDHGTTVRLKKTFAARSST
ncbi:MAG: ATP-binding protein [Bacteroidota bacterium]